MTLNPWIKYSEVIEDACLHCDRKDPALRNMFRCGPTEPVDILIMIHRIFSNFFKKTNRELREDAIFLPAHLKILRMATREHAEALAGLEERINALKKSGCVPDPRYERLHPEEVPDEYIY
jgi:hypothetical protein